MIADDSQRRKQGASKTRLDVMSLLLPRRETRSDSHRRGCGGLLVRPFVEWRRTWSWLRQQQIAYQRTLGFIQLIR